jgi:hypothetical protein
MAPTPDSAQGAPAPVSHIDILFTDAGAWLTFHPVGEAPIRVFVPNKWLLPLMSGFRGRLGYLADAGIFRPGP